MRKFLTVTHWEQTQNCPRSTSRYV